MSLEKGFYFEVLLAKMSSRKFPDESGREDLRSALGKLEVQFHKISRDEKLVEISSDHDISLGGQ